MRFNGMQEVEQPPPQSMVIGSLSCAHTQAVVNSNEDLPSGIFVLTKDVLRPLGPVIMEELRWLSNRQRELDSPAVLPADVRRLITLAQLPPAGPDAVSYGNLLQRLFADEEAILDADPLLSLGERAIAALQAAEA